jgi:hypothetical protein
MLWALVETEQWAGNWERAEELIVEGLDLANDSGNAVALTFMLAVRAVMHVYRGRLEDARADGERVRAVAAATGVAQ